jgi:acyl-CoA synthetase (AMP-forming)/AMP-acid ligase II
MTLKFEHDYLYPDVIPHFARFSPQRNAVICGDQVLSWAALEQRTNKSANALIAAGIVKGDKVCVLMKSSMTMFELFWGVIRCGGVVVALNTMMSGESLLGMIENSDGKLLFTDDANLPAVDNIVSRFTTIKRNHIFVSGAGGGWQSAEAFIDGGAAKAVHVDIAPNDSINIVYTSGSTGTPKGVEHSHLARHSYTFGMGYWFAFDRSSIALLATPLYANGTWATMGPCMYRGGCCVLMPKFSGDEFLELVEKHRCTHTFLVPTQLVAILGNPNFDRYDVSSLRVIDSAGQALMSATFDEVAKRMPKAELWEVYGMSEGFGTIIGPKDYARGKRGSVGQPMILDDIRIIDDNGNELPGGEIGEICGYSLGLMKGYYRDPEATEKMIWIGPHGRTYLKSGDLGRIDADGYLYICGRSKDMIKSGGINVYPADIESVFTKHPAVREATAVGIPHDKWMETPILFVILHHGTVMDAEALKDWGNERLGKFQRVSEVRIVEDFPRVTYGKVDKKKLRAPFWEGRERDI